MTYREFLNSVINGTVDADGIAFATAEVAKLDARNDKRRNTLTKEQKANEEVKAAILEAIGIGSLTAAEISKACEISTQKASALCRLLVADGKLSVHDIKVKGKGSVKAYEAVLA
jgi:hypothetical protein